MSNPNHNVGIDEENVTVPATMAAFANAATQKAILFLFIHHSSPYHHSMSILVLTKGCAEIERKLLSPVAGKLSVLV